MAKKLNRDEHQDWIRSAPASGGQQRDSRYPDSNERTDVQHGGNDPRDESRKSQLRGHEREIRGRNEEPNK